ncbi:MAG: hypothetical protein AAFP22_07555 [Planctomycetota bacterium]
MTRISRREKRLRDIAQWLSWNAKRWPDGFTLEDIDALNLWCVRRFGGVERLKEPIAMTLAKARRVDPRIDADAYRRAGYQEWDTVEIRTVEHPKRPQNWDSPTESPWAIDPRDLTKLAERGTLELVQNRSRARRRVYRMARATFGQPSEQPAEGTA